MNRLYRQRFLRDLKKIKDKVLRERIDRALQEVEEANRLDDIKNLKKMEGAANAYRIRVAEFRIAFYLVDDTIEFVRCLDRKELYRYFPE